MNKRAVLIVLDGHRMDFVDPDLTPAVQAVGARGAVCHNHRGVFPTVTRVASASISTGCRPGRHGLLGNFVALPDHDGRLVIRDASKPDFRGHLRAATGQCLRVPSMPERIAAAGGTAVCSNASAGAAHFQDPEHHGRLYHRDGCFGPGASSIPAPFNGTVDRGKSGDRMLADYFCHEVLPNHGAALSVLWLSEPDIVMHATILGSGEHLDAVHRADATVGRVAEVVDRLRDAGEDVLMMVASDHGQETVVEAVDVVRLLIDAGLKESQQSDDIVVVPQGSSALIYSAENARSKIREIVDFLERQDWAAEVFHGPGLDTIGLNQDGGLVAAFAMGRLDGKNQAGVEGLTLMAESEPGKAAPYVGHGMHGGLGAFETRPILIASGGVFDGGGDIIAETSVLDIAPTILAHLGLPVDGMDGRSIGLLETV